MSNTWQGEDLPLPQALVFGDWLRILRRALPLAVLVLGGLVVLLALRLIERPLCGLRRPVTPFVTQAVCRAAFVVIGMRYQVRGAPLVGAGAIVANHVSWLDIFALNAKKRIYFVSKSEVAAWPVIGWLARATGTVFIRRHRSAATTQIDLFRARLRAGHKLLFFPEGTSTDGMRVLPFKPTLFAAFFDPALRDNLQLQAVTLIYDAPKGADRRIYGWWGEMEFGAHLLATLAIKQHGGVRVIYHPPVALTQFSGRKDLALALEQQVRSALPHDG
jgi:lyso-ornithine lipid O-acyltransferase